MNKPQQKLMESGGCLKMHQVQQSLQKMVAEEIDLSLPFNDESARQSLCLSERLPHFHSTMNQHGKIPPCSSSAGEMSYHNSVLPCSSRAFLHLYIKKKDSLLTHPWWLFQESSEASGSLSLVLIVQVNVIRKIVGDGGVNIFGSVEFSTTAFRVWSSFNQGPITTVQINPRYRLYGLVQSSDGPRSYPPIVSGVHQLCEQCNDCATNQQCQLLSAQYSNASGPLSLMLASNVASVQQSDQHALKPDPGLVEVASRNNLFSVMW